MNKEAEFFNGYIAAALWSTNDDDGDPLDYSWDVSTVTPETREKMIADCKAFIKKCQDNGLDPFPEYPKNDSSHASHSGHDFWLTRNGHGAGYWDGDLPEAIGESLTKIADSFGPCDLYVGDDGNLYI